MLQILQNFPAKSQEKRRTGAIGSDTVGVIVSRGLVYLLTWICARGTAA
jgi:hypothetical protein